MSYIIGFCDIKVDITFAKEWFCTLMPPGKQTTFIFWTVTVTIILCTDIDSIQLL